MPCSFCSLPSHNIRRCTNTVIYIMFEEVKTIYVNTIMFYTENLELRFNQVVDSIFTLLELRAISAKYIHSRTTLRTKHQIIQSLYDYYSSHTYILPEQHPRSETIRIPTSPDPIPDFAGDLDASSPSSSVTHFENDVNWYIDTIPTPQSLLTSDYVAEGVYRTQMGTGVRNFARATNNVQLSYPIKKFKISVSLVKDDLVLGKEDCSICYENIECSNMVKLDCGHQFCGSCIKGTLQTHVSIACNPSCALCRKPMVSFSVKNLDTYDLVSKHCIM